MSNLIVLLNHSLTQDQIIDAYYSLQIDKIVYPEDTVKRMWANVPTTGDSLEKFLTPIYEWIKKTSTDGDYLLVQGDFGATYLVVRFALLNCLIPIYSKSKRIARENILPSGEVKLHHIFLHKGFRIYGI